MTPFKKSDWLIPCSLLLFAFVPMAAGIVRLAELGHGGQITPENARFFAAPIPVVIHIVCSVVFCSLGAFQFSEGFRRRHLNWHRIAGRVLVPCGLAVALTGLWITWYNPEATFIGETPSNYDGPSLYWVRLVVGTAMAAFLSLGLAAILRRDIANHQAWMIRGYALGLGAATQVFTHLPWFFFPGIRGQLTRTLCMSAGWVINAVVAEWVIARARRKSLPDIPKAQIEAWIARDEAEMKGFKKADLKRK